MATNILVNKAVDSQGNDYVPIVEPVGADGTSIVGTAGTPASGVLSVQGVAGGQAVPVSGTVTSTPSGTQTVSGTVTANAGTNLNTASLALEAGGHLASVDAQTARIPTNGQKTMAGSLPVTIASDQGILPTQLPAARLAAIGLAYPTAPDVLALRMASNGTTIDPWLNNTTATLLTSAARTASTQSAAQVNYNARGVLVFVNVTAASGTGGLQVTFQMQDPVSGSWAQISRTPNLVTATGQYVYALGPGSTDSAAAPYGAVQASTNLMLPRNWRINVTHGDSSSYTYSASASYVD